ncbi:MAG TPA: uracil-DNA glycosylase family protein [Acidobacteriota bacterium]|nr:uracil-DNA glycosylase family protein [Acidobacteriota bacterium]
MKELADHLEFFAEQGVTHVRIPEAPSPARRSSPEEGAQEDSGQKSHAPWEEAAADPSFAQADLHQEPEGQSDLFAAEAAKKGGQASSQSPSGGTSAPESDSSPSQAAAPLSPERESGSGEDSASPPTPDPSPSSRSPQAPESESTVSDTSMFTSVPELPPEPIEMEEIRYILGDCTRCPLSETRTQIVFGVGNPAADLLFVGEAPGADEDELGLPFVGAAGKLLSRIIRAIGLYRDQVYVANILKCRPPNNRDPLPEEVEQCGPFLYKQIQAVEPLVIVALGRYASQTLLQTETPISSLRGRFHDFHGIPLMPTFHPSYLLRNASGKRPVWEDMQAVRNKLQELGSPYYADRD